MKMFTTAVSWDDTRLMSRKRANNEIINQNVKRTIQQTTTKLTTSILLVNVLFHAHEG